MTWGQTQSGNFITLNSRATMDADGSPQIIVKST